MGRQSGKRHNDLLKQENLRMSAELDITRELQQMILPKAWELQQIPGLDIAGFTDGITEAENTDGNQYGLKRLCEVVRQHYNLSATEIQQAIVEDVRGYIGVQKVFDDITLVVLKKN